MNIATTIPDFNAPVLDHARKDFPLLRAGMTVRSTNRNGWLVWFLHAVC